MAFTYAHAFAGADSSGRFLVGREAQCSLRDAAWVIVQRLAGFALAIELVGDYLAAHPNVAYASLADGLRLEDLDVLAEDQDVEPLIRRALAIFRSSLGDGHADTIAVGQNYDLLLAAMTPRDPK